MRLCFHLPPETATNPFPPPSIEPAEPVPERSARLEQLKVDLVRAEIDNPPPRRQPARDILSLLDGGICHRTVQIANRHQQIDELHHEIRRLDREIAGYESAIEAVLIDLLGEATQRRLPTWSPTPVVGFRAWTIREHGLGGVRTVWTKPWLTATCRRSETPQREVPHADGSCGRLGCGIYAVKDPAWLISDSPVPMWDGDGVLGLVLLTGKIVEHERGYRAARAEVVAVSALYRGKVTHTSDRRWIARLFSTPIDTITMGPVRDGGGSAGEKIADYLWEEARKVAEQWTSADNNV